MDQDEEEFTLWQSNAQSTTQIAIGPNSQCTSAVTSISPTQPSTDSSQSSVLTKFKHSAPVGAIAGGVVGGLFFICAVAIFILLLKRQRRIQNPIAAPVQNQSFGAQEKQSKQKEKLLDMPTIHGLSTDTVMAQLEDNSMPRSSQANGRFNERHSGDEMEMNSGDVFEIDSGEYFEMHVENK